MSNPYQLQTEETALRWCDVFRILGFKPGLEYWKGMNLNLSDRQAQCVSKHAMNAHQESETPLPTGIRSPRDEYLPAQQRILDDFLASIAGECGQSAAKEILAWAEYDHGVNPEDGRDEFEWFTALTDIRNEPESIRSRIGIDRQLMERITDLIENDIISPFLSLKKEFDDLCAKIKGGKYNAEYCKNSFTSIHLITNSMNVRRCWGEIQRLLARQQQDVVFEWYQDTRKDTLARFPQFNREILPMRQ